MKKIVEKADVLIEAVPYIQAFRGKTVIIKFGGSAMEDKACHDGILADTAFMECVGLKPVIVHGGGKAISQRMSQEGIRPTFVKGLRVTDEDSIRLVDEVLNDKVNPKIVDTLIALGARATGIQGQSILRVEKLMPVDDATNQPLDAGFVGQVTEVDTAPINAILDADKIPVITPLGCDTEGQIHNVNADNAAAAIAKALQAHKLVFLSDVPGLLKDPNDPDSVISTLKQEDAETLIQRGVIDGGMLPKIQGAMSALAGGVKKIHIIDGRLPHSLLLEIFTEKGIGTEIVYND